MELIFAAYLVVAAVFNAAHHEGMIKDDTVQRTYTFEQGAQRDTLERIDRTMKSNEWDKKDNQSVTK
jgi:hypothetical protein